MQSSASLSPDDQAFIVSDGRPVPRLLPPELPKIVPIPGRGRGKLISCIDDVVHLKD